MKLFLRHLSLIITTTLLACWTLDFGYTKIIQSSENRELSQKLFHLKNTHFDYILLGNSRMEFVVNPALIKSNTGLNGYNFSFNGARLIDNILCLQMFLENGNSCNKVILQLDDVNTFHKDASQLFKPYLVPFIDWKPVYELGPRIFSDFKLLKYIPFYKYAKYNFHWNPKELVACVFLDKDPTQLGFTPLSGTINNTDQKTELSIRPINTNLLELLNICEERNIEVRTFTAPIYHPVNFKEFEKHLLAKYRLNHKSYASEMQESNYFKDTRHLNGAGAHVFSKQFGQDMASWEWN